MDGFLWIGTSLGAIIGLFHMVYVFSTRLGRPGLSTPKTLIHGAATWALWTVFGAYVLAFWILGAVVLGVSHLLPAKRATG